MGTEHRVEIARMSLTRDGKPVVSVRPVKADLAVFDKDKKWYETSNVKKMEKLWKNDIGRAAREAEIIKDAGNRQSAKMISAIYKTPFYEGVLNKMNEVQKDFTKDHVRERNIAVMEAMTEKIRDTLSYENDPETFRNDIRSIRSLMETVGITQAEANKFGEDLIGEDRHSFYQVRTWEKNIVNGSWNAALPELPDNMDLKTCVEQMLKNYQNAFYEKMGYEDKLDPKFKEQLSHTRSEMNVEKKAVTFDALLKAGATEFMTPEQKHRYLHPEEYVNKNGLDANENKDVLNEYKDAQLKRFGNEKIYDRESAKKAVSNASMDYGESKRLNQKFDNRKLAQNKDYPFGKKR